MPVLDRSFFARPFLTVARDLIGRTLIRNGCGGRIVEVEAYAVDGDAACHTATRRSSRLFCEENPPGTAYVYLNYGIHWMLNVLAEEGILLIRALEPLHGIPEMRARRGREDLRALCSGPGKVGQALGFTGRDHGADLTGGVFRSGGFDSFDGLETEEAPAGAGNGMAEGAGDGAPAAVVTDRRIGITKAVEFPWRFLEAGSPWVSVRPGPAASGGSTFC